MHLMERTLSVENEFKRSMIEFSYVWDNLKFACFECQKT